MELRKFLLLLAAAIVILLLIVAWFSPSVVDFRTDNPSWNGLQDIAVSYPILPLESLSELPAAPSGSTLIIVPYLDFTAEEFMQLDNFVTDGGTLILADDYGYGNHVLEYLGLDVRFTGQTLLDPLSNYKNSWFPKITYFNNPGPIAANIQSLVLNHATGLTNVTMENIMAQSSRFSYLDSNNNQIRDEDETTGPLPVISHHSLGKGKVIVIADSSIFINSMRAIADNDILLQYIGTLTPINLFFDQSHLPPSNLSKTKDILVRIHDFLVTPSGTIGLVILTLTVVLIPVWHQRSALSKGDNNGQKNE
ncbi:DUF4350 domain-containing protein [Chloroflexota bacterium]